MIDTTVVEGQFCSFLKGRGSKVSRRQTVSMLMGEMSNPGEPKPISPQSMEAVGYVIKVKLEVAC